MKNGKPLNNEEVYKPWDKTYKRTGVNISLYQGSNYFLACQFLNLFGAQSETLQKQFGHCELKTTKKYAKLKNENFLGIQGVPRESLDTKFAKNN